MVEGLEWAQLMNEFAALTPRLASAIVIFLFFILAARLVRGFVNRFGNNRRLSADVINLMKQVAETSLLVFGAVTALGTLGINVAAMIAGLGLVGFALGFALKDLLSNFLAGMLILFYNPFVRGDKVSIGVNEGEVVEINMRYTVLRNGTKKILIPNANLFSQAVIVEPRVEQHVDKVDSVY
jgi:small conductance mechanosensitive channel